MPETMPPKNKPDDSMVGVYDVEIMNEIELKKYITALKEESERMKEAFTEHQRNKRELEILLKNTQEDILERYEVLIQKELELQQLICESSDILKAEDENQVIDYLGRNEKLYKTVVDSFIESQAAEMCQLGDDTSLTESLQYRKRLVDDMHFAHRMISADMQENSEEEWTRIIQMRKKSLERFAADFNQEYHTKKLEFFDEKINTLTEVYEGTIKEDYHKNPTAVQAERMALYFKELFWKNIKVTTNLKVKLENLEKELNKLKMSLREAKEENEELLRQTEDQKGEWPEFAHSTDAEDKVLDAVTFENDTLKEKLRQVTEERDNLKHKFISSMRKIYEKANFSSFLAEQMLVSLQDNNCNSDNTQSIYESISSSLMQNELIEEAPEDSSISTKVEELMEEMSSHIASES